MDKINETNDISEFMIYIKATINNPRYHCCWKGFIKSSQDRKKIDVRLLDEKYDDIISNLLYNLNCRVKNHNQFYKTEYIENIINMFMINDESMINNFENGLKEENFTPHPEKGDKSFFEKVKDMFS